MGGEQTHRLFAVPIFVLLICCPMRDLDASEVFIPGKGAGSRVKMSKRDDWCLIFMPEVLQLSTGLDV